MNLQITDVPLTIYRPGQAAEALGNPVAVKGDGPVAGFELEMARIWDTGFGPSTEE